MAAINACFVMIATAGTIDNNPGNTHDKAVCYQVLVPDDCLSSSGHLLANKLVVKLAVNAAGGLLTTNATGNALQLAQEVEVRGRTLASASQMAG